MTILTTKRTNTKFGWHSGTIYCKDINVMNDFKIFGSLTFGDATTDTITVTGTATFNQGMVFGTNISGRPIYMNSHVVSDTAGSNASIYFGEAISKTQGEHITLYSKQNWSGNDGVAPVAARPISAKCYIDSGATWNNAASGITSILAYVQMNGTMNEDGITIAALAGELAHGSGTYTAIDYETCLSLKNANYATISSGDRFFAHMYNSVNATIDAAICIKQAAGAITNLFEFTSCTGGNDFIADLSGGDGSDDTITGDNWKSLAIDIDGTTHYIPCGKDLKSA